jgi:hypothetical protein
MQPKKGSRLKNGGNPLSLLENIILHYIPEFGNYKRYSEKFLATPCKSH